MISCETVAVAIFALIGWTTLGSVLIRLHSPLIDSNNAFYHVFNLLTTTGIRKIEIKEDPLLLLSLLLYILIGLAVLSLFINLLHSKFSQAYWLPGRLNIPSLRHDYLSNSVVLASFDSEDEDHLSECPVNHFTTLGLLQTDDKCPLICLIRREHAYKDAITQTPGATVPLGLSKRKLMTPDAVFIDQQHHQSRDNVSDLMVETYSSSKSPRSFPISRATEKPTML